MLLLRNTHIQCLNYLTPFFCKPLFLLRFGKNPSGGDGYSMSPKVTMICISYHTVHIWRQNFCHCVLLCDSALKAPMVTLSLISSHSPQQEIALGHVQRSSVCLIRQYFVGKKTIWQEWTLAVDGPGFECHSFTSILYSLWIWLIFLKLQFLFLRNRENNTDLAE